MAVLNLRNVPDEVYRRAKIQAARELTTLQEWVVRAILAELERQAPAAVIPLKRKG